MKIQLVIFLIITKISIMGCSSDNGTSENLNDKGAYLKSRIYLNLPVDAPNYDEFYQYENGLLKSASGFTFLQGTTLMKTENL